jgi:hypothetical protein
MNLLSFLSCTQAIPFCFIRLVCRHEIDCTREFHVNVGNVLAEECTRSEFALLATTALAKPCNDPYSGVRHGIDVIQSNETSILTLVDAHLFIWMLFNQVNGVTLIIGTQVLALAKTSLIGFHQNYHLLATKQKHT